MFNQKIDTPLGAGIEQGKYGVMSEEEGQEDVVVAVHKLVRFTSLTDKIKKHLLDKNCLTPRPTNQALFHFDLSETGSAWAEFIYCLALGLIVLFFACKDWTW